MFRRKQKPPQEPPEAAQAAPKARPKRRRKSDEERRETLLRVRLNDAEHERLKALAAEAGVKPSTLIRDHIDKLQVRNRDDERQRIGLLNRINANCNMVARWVNTHRGAADVVEVVAHLQAIRRGVEAVADKVLDDDARFERQQREIEQLKAKLAQLEAPQEPEEGQQ